MDQWERDENRALGPCCGPVHGPLRFNNMNDLWILLEIPPFFLLNINKKPWNPLYKCLLFTTHFLNMCIKCIFFLYFQMWKLRGGDKCREKVGSASQNWLDLTSQFPPVSGSSSWDAYSLWRMDGCGLNSVCTTLVGPVIHSRHSPAVVPEWGPRMSVD